MSQTKPNESEGSLGIPPLTPSSPTPHLQTPAPQQGQQQPPGGGGAGPTTTTNTSDWMKVHVLEGDGVVPHLFQYLYKMDRALRGRHHAIADVSATSKDKVGYALPIPDTVVYDHNFPQAWFRYRDREIIKRPGKYLDAQHIYKGFCSVKPNSGGICAQFSCAVPDPEDPLAMCTRVYYLSPSDLEELLYSRGTMGALVKHGVLQKFVPPRGSCNDMIEVVWSPKMTITRRRVNRFSLASRSVSMEMKAATFDGPPHLSLESAANDRVSRELTEMVASIADHLLRHEHKCVSRIAALFKQDRYCQPWLHYATSVRIEGDSLIGGSIQRLPVNLSPAYLHPRSDVTNEFIEQQLQRKVVLDFRPVRPKKSDDDEYTPRYRFAANALSQSAAHPRNTRLQHIMALREQFSGEQPETSSQQPSEVRIVQTFLEDTFYALYAARMTMGSKPKPAVIQVPKPVEDVLGNVGMNQLMVGILQLKRDLEAEAALAKTAILLSPEKPQPEDEEEEEGHGEQRSDLGSLQGDASPLSEAGTRKTAETQSTGKEGEETTPSKASTLTLLQSPKPPSVAGSVKSSASRRTRATTATTATGRRGGGTGAQFIPRVYVSMVDNESYHQVPLTTLREHCDAFMEELKQHFA